jgi:hypothetical protein
MLKNIQNRAVASLFSLKTKNKKKLSLLSLPPQKFHRRHILMGRRNCS